MPKVMELDPATLTSLMQSVEEGLLSFETGVQMQSCAVVDNVISYFHSQLTGKSSPEQDRVRRYLQEAPQCLQKILHLMFQLVMTGEFSSMWSISRPLLGLILLHDQHFLQLKEPAYQPADRGEAREAAGLLRRSHGWRGEQHEHEEQGSFHSEPVQLCAGRAHSVVSAAPPR
ncbi:unnamed protein product [Effrenium voratum]|nr:unnamed protein product [Effrenium voratum]